MDSDFHDEQNDETDGVPFRFYTPPEMEAGVYAETVAVWHTPYDFVIDFASIQLAQQQDPDDAESPWEVPARIVSRVRIPAGLVFDVIRTINARMEQYEAEWGEIRAPEPREQREDPE